MRTKFAKPRPIGEDAHRIEFGFSQAQVICSSEEYCRDGRVCPADVAMPLAAGILQRCEERYHAVTPEYTDSVISDLDLYSESWHYANMVNPLWQMCLDTIAAYTTYTGIQFNYDVKLWLQWITNGSMVERLRAVLYLTGFISYREPIVSSVRLNSDNIGRPEVNNTPYDAREEDISFDFDRRWRVARRSIRFNLKYAVGVSSTSTDRIPEWRVRTILDGLDNPVPHDARLTCRCTSLESRLKAILGDLLWDHVTGATEHERRSGVKYTVVMTPTYRRGEWSHQCYLAIDFGYVLYIPFNGWVLQSLGIESDLRSNQFDRLAFFGWYRAHQYSDSDGTNIVSILKSVKADVALNESAYKAYSNNRAVMPASELEYRCFPYSECGYIFKWHQTREYGPYYLYLHDLSTGRSWYCDRYGNFQATNLYGMFISNVRKWLDLLQDKYVSKLMVFDRIKPEAKVPLIWQNVPYLSFDSKRDVIFMRTKSGRLGRRRLHPSAYNSVHGERVWVNTAVVDVMGVGVLEKLEPYCVGLSDIASGYFKHAGSLCKLPATAPIIVFDDFSLAVRIARIVGGTLTTSVRVPIDYPIHLDDVRYTATEFSLDTEPGLYCARTPVMGFLKHIYSHKYTGRIPAGAAYGVCNDLSTAVEAVKRGFAIGLLSDRDLTPELLTMTDKVIVVSYDHRTVVERM